MKRIPRLVIGVIGNDIHVVANRLLARGLRHAGYIVCNLGVTVPPADFITATIEHEADAVIVSSLNGEGEDWLRNLRQKFTDANRANILLYVGGNLSLGDRNQIEVEEHFLSFGFNRAYHRPSSLDILIKDLSKDLAYVSE